MISKPYKIFNYTKDGREYSIGSVKFLHLATIFYEDKRYIVYRTLDTGEQYIEELITSKLSDHLIGLDDVRLVSDDKIWRELLMIAQLEGITNEKQR